MLSVFFNNIYNIGQIPEEWLPSTFFKLPKTSNVKTCAELHTEILMSHTREISPTIIHARLYKKREKNIGDTKLWMPRYF